VLIFCRIYFHVAVTKIPVRTTYRKKDVFGLAVSEISVHGRGSFDSVGRQSIMVAGRVE
jgi:hypothetical protein